MDCRWVSVGKTAYELEGCTVSQGGKTEEECFCCIGKAAQMAIAKFEGLLRDYK